MAGQADSPSTLFLTLPVWYLHLGRGGVAADLESCAVGSKRGFPRFWVSLLPGVSFLPWSCSLRTVALSGMWFSGVDALGRRLTRAASKSETELTIDDLVVGNPHHYNSHIWILRRFERA